MIDLSLFDGCTGVVAAVSGGPDSMAMLAMLLGRFPITVAHVNYGQRAEADGEEKAVRAFCEKNGVPCRVERFTGAFTEDAARRFRYEFFDALAAQLHYSHIATAHQLEDDAETFFLHLLRGCAVAGSIPRMRRSENALIVRPMLDCTKRELRDYCDAHAVPYAIDASNAEAICRRNVLRNRILPQLRQLEPELDRAIRRFVRLNRRDDEYLTAQARQTGLRCDAHPALLTRALREAVGPISAAQSEQALRLCRAESGKKIVLNGKTVQRVYDRLVVIDTPQQAFAQTALHAGENRLPGGVLTLTHVDRDADLSDTLGTLFVRSMRAGDRVRLQKRGTKTVKKLLSDAKVPQPQRLLVPIVTGADGQIVYVGGFGFAQRVGGGAGWQVDFKKNSQFF